MSSQKMQQSSHGKRKQTQHLSQMLQKARAKKVAKEEAVIKLPAVLGIHRMTLERQKASMELRGEQVHNIP